MSRRGTVRQPSRWPGIWTIARDVLTFFGGWMLIFTEVRHPEVRWLVMLMGGTAIGIPGFAVGATAIFDAIARRQLGIDDSRSGSPPPAPLPLE